MPLYDHFRLPVKNRFPWESLHSVWMAELANRLNAILPTNYVALERMRIGYKLEIDVATLEIGTDSLAHENGSNGGVATRSRTYTPPAASATISTIFPDVIELRVFAQEGSASLVAAIELVSPGNKDRDEERMAFASKIATYLRAGVSVIVMDIVTTRRANLHNILCSLIGAPAEVELPADTHLYSAAYRPILRLGKPEIDIWTASFFVGDPLPTMPLRLIGDLFVPVEFEMAYTAACRQRRFP